MYFGGDVGPSVPLPGVELRASAECHPPPSRIALPGVYCRHWQPGGPLLRREASCLQEGAPVQDIPQGRVRWWGWLMHSGGALFSSPGCGGIAVPCWPCAASVFVIVTWRLLSVSSRYLLTVSTFPLMHLMLNDFFVPYFPFKLWDAAF